jgi:broad specificity phosphatase PhoE
MTPERSDALIDELRALPARAPSEARASRTHRRCREALATRTRSDRVAWGVAAVAHGAVALMLAAYLAGVVTTALRFRSPL